MRFMRLRSIMYNYEVGVGLHYIITSDMQGLVWGEPELAHEYDFDMENIIAKNRKFEACNMEECNFCSLSLYIGNLID